MKIMFLTRYNPWGKTMRDQLQSWNNLSFDPQKTDIDEQINLVLTSGNMLKQDKQAKIDTFIETMPTIIQTHLIIAPNWEEVTKNVTNLEHIIQQCEPPAIAPLIPQGAGAVLGLYSHIEQSQDQDSASIPKPFKSARGHGGKKSKGKAKQQQQPQPLPTPPKQEEQYEVRNNYYHNENYRGNNRGCRPYRGQHNIRRPYRGEGDNKITKEVNFKAAMGNLILLVVAIIIITMVIIKADVAMAMVVTFTGHVVMEEAIIKAIIIIHTINITHMMMGLSLSNMVHQAHFVEASIILLNIVLRENMTLTISCRKLA